MSMNSFELRNPKTVEEAIRFLDPKDEYNEKVRLFAGGQDLLTEMKDHLVEPEILVNLKGIAALRKMTYDLKTGLSIGAGVSIEDIASSGQVRKYFPALAMAAESIGSLQIRNVGTIGGNLCQRPRCYYYRNENAFCLKKGGKRCFAAGGENKYNAILGGGPSFIVHPSDTATALVTLGAVVTIAGPKGVRKVPLEKFFTLPTVDVRRENVLKPNEIVTEILVPNAPYASRSVYLKFRERSSMDWAMSAVAVALNVVNGKIVDSRITLGGVAPIPWRVPKAEALLKGKSPSPELIQQVAEAALNGAIALEQNGYKITLTKTLVRRAIGYLATTATPPAYRDVNRM